MALDSTGGWFSSGSTQIVNYRMLGNRYVVDRVLDRAELIAGLGSGRPRVEEVVAYWPALVPKDEVLPQVSVTEA